MTRPVKPCAAPAMGGAPLCDRARRHRGQHSVTLTEDGRERICRWGGSGPTQPEAERRVGQTLLRLDAGARAALENLAAKWGATRSQVVARLLLQAAVDV